MEFLRHNRAAVYKVSISEYDKEKEEKKLRMGGITPLLQTLKELEKRQIPGKILTTNYLNFSEPRALKKL